VISTVLELVPLRLLHTLHRVNAGVETDMEPVPDTLPLPIPVR